MVHVPSRPGPFVILSYTNTSVVGGAEDPSDMGDGHILEWEVAWGLSPNQADFSGNLNFDGGGIVSGLTQGKTYYFWNRVRNEAGWSDVSARSEVKLRDHPDVVKAPTIFASKTQTSVKVTVTPNGNGGSRITGYELAYGTSPASTAVSITQASPVFNLTGLVPGGTYYFWAKASNVYGESSAWSVRGATVLIAGAHVKVGAVWKRAVPYVRVGGVWKLGEPWIKSNGEWHPSAD